MNASIGSQEIVLPFFTRTVTLYVMGTQYLGLSSLFAPILCFLSMTELGTVAGKTGFGYA